LSVAALHCPPATRALLTGAADPAICSSTSASTERSVRVEPPTDASAQNLP
jgi:hypothetical protein